MQLYIRNIAAFKKTGKTHAACPPFILGLEHRFSGQCCWAAVRWIPVSTRGPCQAVEGLQHSATAGLL